MSWQASNWARELVPPGLVSVSAMAVLIEFADFADAQGRKAYPALFKIAWRLGCTERNVAGHVAKLREAGLLIESDDQSPVAHMPADERPIVYELPVARVRSDTYEEALEAHRAQRREQRERQAERRRKAKVTAPAPPAADAAHAERGMQYPSRPTKNGYEESFHGGMKNPSNAYEESFRTGTKHPSYKQSLEHAVEHAVETNTAREIETSATDVIEHLCNRLHAGIHTNWEAAPEYRRGQQPQITNGWRAAITKLLNDRNAPASVIEQVIDYSQSSWWADKVTDANKLLKHFTTMATQIDNAHRPSAAHKKDTALVGWAQDLNDPDDALRLMGLSPSAHNAVTGQTSLPATPTAIEAGRGPVIDIHPSYTETHWESAA